MTNKYGPLAVSRDSALGRVNEDGFPISGSGMDFTRSLKNKNSRLWKSILYMRQVGYPVSRQEIVEKVWKRLYTGRGPGWILQKRP
jgi:hypothetical protein